MRRFSLYRRNGIYYARFWDPITKTYTSAKSTRERTEKNALSIVAYWDRFGFDDGKTTDDVVNTHSVFQTFRNTALTDDHVRSIIEILKDRNLITSAVIKSNPVASEHLISYLERFWDFDRSEYVTEKQNYGHSIGRRHCYEQTHRLSHWRESFAEKTVGSVTRSDLQAFITTLKTKGLASKTIKNILTVGSVAFTWLTDRGEIESNPAAGLKKFVGKSAQRGILTVDEARRVFTVNWPDERARVGNLVAMTTGLRSGEILALCRDDIAADRLHIRHSWSSADGLKSPKNGEERTTPLLPEVRDYLLKLADTNPHGDGFIFYHVDPLRPCDGEVLRKGLIRALVDMVLPEADRKIPDKREKARAEWKARAVSFHSWRHFFATHIADRVEMRSVQLATGHKSNAMAEHYANHVQDEHFQGVSEAVYQAFGNVVPFKQTAS